MKKFLPLAVLGLALLSMKSLAHADSFNFSFSTDAAGCAITGACGSTINLGSGSFTTGPQLEGPGAFGATVFPITSLSGSLNGSTMTLNTTFGDPADVIQDTGGNWGLFSKGPALIFDSNGQTWDLSRLDFSGTGTDNVLFNESTHISQPVDLKIVSVSVPEPAQVSFVVLALVGLAGMGWRRRVGRLSN